MADMGEKNPQHTFSAELIELLQGYKAEKINIGWSSSVVYRLSHISKDTLILKINDIVSNSIFNHEHEILTWLKDKLPVPQVLYYEKSDYEFLLMSEIKGAVSYEAYSKSDIERNLQILAYTLLKIHSIDIKKCPFDMSIPVLLKEAKRRYSKGMITNKNFDYRWRDKTPEQLISIIEENIPENVVLRFTHGDYCLPNIIIQNGNLSGIVDWGSAGINDIYYDLAAVVWSIGFNYGEKWVPYFLKHYGVEMKDLDNERIRFYQMLNEFLEF